MTSNLEKDYWNEVVKRSQENVSKAVCKATFNPKESSLKRLRKLAIKYAYSQEDFVFEFLSKSEFIDSFCESLGYVEKVQRGISDSSPLKTNPHNILITVANLTKHGGGIYYEIKDIVEMYMNKKVFLLFTDVDEAEHLDEVVREQLAQYSQLTLVFGQSDEIGKVKKLFDTVIEIAPVKIYHYLGHDNTYASTLVQSGISKNICVFSYDHGFSLGLDNTAYDTYIAKRPTDYEMLRNKYGDKVIYIPCWNKDIMLKNNYVPFNSHKKTITACAAVRFYKLSGAEGKNYIDFVLESLQATGGKHIHYGVIPDEKLVEIKTKIKNMGLSEEQFVHIAWADNLPQSMYDNQVDLFLEPFPIVSYKITLDVLSAGIPILIKKSYRRMNMVDFIYENPLSWENKEDFLSCIKNMTKKELEKHSILSRKYYEDNHLPSVLQASFVQEKSFAKPERIRCLDNRVVEISLLDGILIDDSIEKLGSSEKNGGLQLKKRLKNIYYLSQLLLAQVPIIDWAFKNKKRKKILTKILKYWR